MIAAKGGVKVRSVAGHHVKIIEKMSEILNDEMVMAIGNAMRSKRNEDFYGGGIFISEKESSEYLENVKRNFALKRRGSSVRHMFFAERRTIKK